MINLPRGATFYVQFKLLEDGVSPYILPAGYKIKLLFHRYGKELTSWFSSDIITDHGWGSYTFAIPAFETAK